MENIIFAIKTIWGAVLEVSGLIILFAVIAAVRFVVVNLSKEN
jgi:hypothetical protein